MHHQQIEKPIERTENKLIHDHQSPPWDQKWIILQQKNKEMWKGVETEQYSQAISRKIFPPPSLVVSPAKKKSPPPSFFLLCFLSSTNHHPPCCSCISKHGLATAPLQLHVQRFCHTNVHVAVWWIVLQLLLTWKRKSRPNIHLRMWLPSTNKQPNSAFERI